MRARKADPRKAKVVWRKRDIQNSRLYNLTLDINDIKQEISRLRMLRDVLETRRLHRYDDIDGSCQKVVAEYFQVFAKGFAASPHDALSYVYHVMAPDIHVNNFRGRDMMLDQLKTHSATFDNLEFRLIDCMVIPLGGNRVMVKSTARFHATITRHTIAIMFPHILPREDIIQTLLGRSIADFGRYDFEIDAETFQITCCNVVLDMVTCFAKILQNPIVLALLFHRALLVDEFYIGDKDETTEHDSIEECDDNNNDENEQPVSALPIANGNPIAASKMRLGHILDDHKVLENGIVRWRSTDAC